MKTFKRTSVLVLGSLLALAACGGNANLTPATAPAADTATNGASFAYVATASTPLPVAAAPAAAIAHIGHDQCVGFGAVSNTLLPLYQKPTAGNVLLLMDFSPATATGNPGPQWKLAIRGNNFSVYTHVVQLSDTLGAYGPYTAAGDPQYAVKAEHGVCISEWSGVNAASPIAYAKTNVVGPTVRYDGIAEPKAVTGAVAYAMFATTDNGRREPALAPGWTFGDFSNKCTDPICGRLPHATDKSEWIATSKAVTAALTWPTNGRTNVSGVIVLLNPN